MTPHHHSDVFSRSSRGRPQNVLGTFRINLPGTSLGRQIRTSLDVISRRPQDVRLGRPRDGQIGSLGDVLITLDGDVLGMSWGPIFAGWAVLTFCSSQYVTETKRS